MSNSRPVVDFNVPHIVLTNDLLVNLIKTAGVKTGNRFGTKTSKKPIIWEPKTNNCFYLSKMEVLIGFQ